MTSILSSGFGVEERIYFRNKMIYPDPVRGSVKKTIRKLHVPAYPEWAATGGFLE